MSSARTYEVVTYGCQMNVHDSERLTGLLEDAGYAAAPDGRAGGRRRLQHLRGARERRQQAVRQPRPPRAGEGRAPGHADRRRRLPRAEGPRRRSSRRRRGWTSSSAPTTSARCRCCWSGPGCRRRRRSRSSSRSRCSRRRCRPSASRRTPPGCRSPSAATTPARSASSRRCAARRRTAGPATSSPRSRRWSPRASPRSPCSARTSTRTASEFGDRAGLLQAAARLRRDRGAGAGPLHLARTPREFTDDVIAAMAETPNVMPQLHMPLQSGSDRMLKAMRRSYRQAKYLGIIDQVRAAMPDAAITTDIIVGFPGETEEDFQETHARGPGGALLRGLHVPVLQAPRHPRRRARGAGAARGRPGPLRAPGRAGQRHLLGGEQASWSAAASS